MIAVAEYNVYGVALTNPKWQIDEAQAAQMYGFKAWVVVKFQQLHCSTSKRNVQDVPKYKTHCTSC